MNVFKSTNFSLSLVRVSSVVIVVLLAMGEITYYASHMMSCKKIPPMSLSDLREQLGYKFIKISWHVGTANLYVSVINSPIIVVDYQGDVHITHVILPITLLTIFILVSEKNCKSLLPRKLFCECNLNTLCVILV